MKKFIKRYWPETAGALTGAAAGWLYWYFVGCVSGTCPITTSPLNSSLWGALMGVLLFGLFKREKPKQAGNK